MVLACGTEHNEVARRDVHHAQDTHRASKPSGRPRSPASRTDMLLLSPACSRAVLRRRAIASREFR
jgi:hypothetical protein